ncbi:MAG TPA: DinB family protein [Bacteroidota bacterium]|nr:DinB family protein [Bacteroidota bacterium]
MATFIGPTVGSAATLLLVAIGILSLLLLLVVAIKQTVRFLNRRSTAMNGPLHELEDLITNAAPRLQAISESESAVQPADGKWSKKEILGHLIDSALNNHQRFVRGQFGDELRLPGYEQEQWVKAQAYQEEAWGDLVLLWKMLNLHLLHVGTKIPAGKLQTTCFIGANPPVKLEFILTDYVRHLRHHLEQLGV